MSSIPDDLKTRVDVQIEQLLADTQGQAACYRSSDAAETTDGKGQEALQGEVQADGRIRERDRRDHVAGDSGHDPAHQERDPAHGHGVDTDETCRLAVLRRAAHGLARPGLSI